MYRSPHTWFIGPSKSNLETRLFPASLYPCSNLHLLRREARKIQLSYFMYAVLLVGLSSTVYLYYAVKSDNTLARYSWISPGLLCQYRSKTWHFLGHPLLFLGVKDKLHRTVLFIWFSSNLKATKILIVNSFCRTSHMPVFCFHYSPELLSLTEHPGFRKPNRWSAQSKYLEKYGNKKSLVYTEFQTSTWQNSNICI